MQHGMLAWAVSAALLTACGEKPPNCEPGYDGGERFRISVSGFRDPSVSCDASPLGPGDTFELTAADGLTPVAESDGCHVRAAVGVVPDFLRSVVTECTPGREQLSLECSGEGADGCRVIVGLFVAPYIASDVQIIEDGLLNLGWGGGCQLPMACGGGEQYRVRIERLAPLSTD